MLPVTFYKGDESNRLVSFFESMHLSKGNQFHHFEMLRTSFQLRDPFSNQFFDKFGCPRSEWNYSPKIGDHYMHLERNKFLGGQKNDKNGSQGIVSNKYQCAELKYLQWMQHNKRIRDITADHGRWRQFVRRPRWRPHTTMFELIMHQSSNKRTVRLFLVRGPYSKILNFGLFYVQKIFRPKMEKLYPM